MWSSTQVPHVVRTMLGLTLGLDEHKLRVIAPDVGGGFGGKMPCTPQRVWRAIQDAAGRDTQETRIDTHSPGAGLGLIDPNNPRGETQ
jgi:xanthine dehydrogenase molybdopterin-binding subunit B